MPSKRKRTGIEIFDPNESDPQDENFDPDDAHPPRKSKKRSRPTKASKRTRSRRNRHSGSDIDDDDEEDFSDSALEDSFAGDSSVSDEEANLNMAGRRRRQAATRRKNYKESSDDDYDGEVTAKGEPQVEEVIADSDASDNNKSSPVATRMLVKLKIPKRIPPPKPQPPRRVTRGRTEDASELVELSNSGHHVLPARGTSTSKSPETYARVRSTRAVKGLKKAPEPIVEATQESSVMPANENDVDELGADAEPELAAVGAKSTAVSHDDDDDDAHDVEAVKDPPPVLEEEPGAEEVEMIEDRNDVDDEDEDARPMTRRNRATRGDASAAATAGIAESVETERTTTTRRLARKASAKKPTQEISSDFEPGDESGDEGGGSGSGSDHADPDDGDFHSPTTRGRRSQRNKSRASQRRGRRNAAESGDDLNLDEDELAEELHELREDSRSKRRRRSPPIIYHERETKRRRATAKPVNYYMPPLTAANFEEEEEAAEGPAPTPARGRRRGGANLLWERALNATRGPFGGGGDALLGGPWGTGAAGGADSDSSDDEMMHRTNNAANVGMTPTSAAPVPMGGLGQPAPFEGAGAAHNVGKIKNQKALADADPLGVDTTVDFSKVGGLQGHIDQLKEMVQLPLLYPELFQKFHVTPPRGVLFHGPPGTGKTLLARALANSVSSNGRRITFYMRKGADALSKWVGEAEKQLRLLFEEARKTQPSIIFFDEIDGLAPVRSSKQEQIHASIVSTLLALMDGMDGRGQVIVIGATNRPDNIDPALRRPGRFDREFYFPLPDVEARRSILEIHTRDWGLSDQFKDSLAHNTKGCGGADLRALCTEAALNSIQRTYPQIYGSREKLVVDASKISVHATDFMIALKRLVPSSERSATSGAAPLPKAIEPLLRSQLRQIKQSVDGMMPRPKKFTALDEAMFEPYQDLDHGFGRETLNQEFERSRVFRPRLIIHGKEGMGQNYLASAILHHLEGVHVQNFDLPNLLADGRTMEQVIISQFNEIKRHKPSVIYIPNIDLWYATLSESLGLRTFYTMLRSIPSTDSTLLLATSETEFQDLSLEIRKTLFGFSEKNNAAIARPRQADRKEFFRPIMDYVGKTPGEFPDPLNRKKRQLEQLPVAPPAETKPQSKLEAKAEMERDLVALNALKMQLQPIMDQINRKYKKFRQPVIQSTQLQYLFVESEPDYVRPDVADAQPRPFEIAKDKHGVDVLLEKATGKIFYNLETTTIEERLSNGYYARPKDFLFDIKTLVLDSRNIGDRERTLKAKELLANVIVDTAFIENNPSVAIDWEALYQRKLRREQQRAQEVAEREMKKKQKAAQEATVGGGATGAAEAAGTGTSRIGSDVHGSSNSNGSHAVRPPQPGERLMGAVQSTSLVTTAARFQLRSPVPNANGSSNGVGSTGSGVASGTAGNGRDVQMGGADDDTQPLSQFSQPSQPSQMMPPPIGKLSQFSQRSVVTSLPAGMSPSAVINEASTTKSSDLSLTRSSGNWTQVSNGYHGERSSPLENGAAGDAADEGDSELPDTLPQSGASSEDAWPYSQAHGLARGQIRQEASGALLLHHKQGGAGKPVNVSESIVDPSDQFSMRNSGSSLSQPHTIITADSTSVETALEDISRSTSGLTIEQLEQVNRELMAEIWATRDECNRKKVLDRIKQVFNATIADIEGHQVLMQQSQQGI